MKKIAAALLVVLIGCATRTETVRPNADAVLALYLELSLVRIGVAFCLTSRSVEWSTAFDPARADVRRLRDEYTAYCEKGQVGPYCGPFAKK